jgi:hypothetical protein
MVFYRNALFVAAAIASAGATLAAPAHAAIIVDGNLGDWNVTVADNNGSNFASANTSYGIAGGPFIEDQSDTAGDGGYVGPEYGGQNYDAEFMAAALNGTTLYLALATGQRPDNGLQRYSPGDIRIVANGTTTYGIEVGGGAGGGAGTAQTEGAAGTTYTLNSQGYTSSATSTSAAQTVGSIWKNVTWINDPLGLHSPVQFAINGGSTQVGTADYIYTRNTVTNQHAIIELSFDVSAIIGSGGGLLDITWGPSCSNDLAEVFVVVPSHDIPNPEPATLALFAFGLGAAALRRRRVA